MKSNKVHDFKNGEPWILKGETVHNHMCCGCGLVHFVYVERTGKNQFTTHWYRDDYETERLKKEKRK